MAGVKLLPPAYIVDELRGSDVAKHRTSKKGSLLIRGLQSPFPPLFFFFCVFACRREYLANVPLGRDVSLPFLFPSVTYDPPL